MSMEDGILHQDNGSTILIEKNGERLRTKRTGHTNIRHFVVVDESESRDVSLIEHAPSAEMRADHFSKPLAVALFWKMRQKHGPGREQMRKMFKNTQWKACQSASQQAKATFFFHP